MTDRAPTEPAGGQDDPPDVRTAVVATVWLLADVSAHLADRPSDIDLLRRVQALRAALIRLRGHLGVG